MIIGEVSPSLFIGLGGAGGRVVGRVAQHLKGKWDYERTYKDLTRFLVIDTDSSATRALRGQKEGYGPVDATFLISDFDKQQYADLARGNSFALADPYFTQWVYPDYKFRGGDSAGAGQIRIESRLCLYHALQTRDLAGSITGLLKSLREHPKTAGDPHSAIQVHIAFSIAGGTGAGTFLPLAYVIKNLARTLGAKVKLFAYAIQPHVYQEVTGANFEGVCANAYAALKELEHFNKLDAHGDGDTKSVEFHFDVPQRGGDRVTGRPFEATYILDTPTGFSIQDPVSAIADALYFQVYSPFGQAQASDVDNYAKHTRGLYPSDLAEETGRGFTNFFGSFGLSVLHVPDDDILRYCVLRFAADAVRTYLLMADDALVPPDVRSRFNRYVVTEERVRTLSSDAVRQEYDAAFLGKVELVAAPFKGPDHAQTFWGHLWSSAEGVDERFKARLDALVADVVGGVTERLRTGCSLDAQEIRMATWTDDTRADRLAREVKGALDDLRVALAARQREIDFDFWPEFLAKAGPAESALNPYEQRYVLLRLRAHGGPLSEPVVQETQRAGADAARAWSDDAYKDVRAVLTDGATQLRTTQPRTFYDRFRRDKLDEEFDSIRRQIASQFDERLSGICAGLQAMVRGQVLKALVAASEKVLGTFRDIDQKSPGVAADLERKAATYLDSGQLEERLPDGAFAKYFSEANQYALDEEVLLGPTQRRLWDWYYDDQIRPLLQGPEQLEAVQAALVDALKPQLDRHGREQARGGERVIEEIVFAIRDRVRSKLEGRIKGPGGRGGLTIGDGIALEALYMHLQREPTSRSRAQLLDGFRDGPSVNPGSLWRHPDIGSDIQVYAKNKIDRVVAVKASVLGDVDTVALSAVPHTSRLQVGALKESREGQDPFAVCLREHVGKASNGEFIKDWYDPKRIVFYRYLVNAPIYAFPRVVKDLQVAYRAYQKRAVKAWYLHIDRNLDRPEVYDLDPTDIKQEVYADRLRRLPLLFARGRLVIDPEEGDVLYRSVSTGQLRSFAVSLDQALPTLADWMMNRPQSYQDTFQKDLEEADLALARGRLSAETRGELEALEQKLVAQVRAFEESDEGVERHVRAGHNDLLTATRGLLALRTRSAS